MYFTYIKKMVRENRVAVGLTVLHWLATFFLERLIFEAAPTAHLLDYCLCKLILLPLLFLFWRFVCDAVGKKGSFARSVLLHALPILVLQIVWLLWRHPFVLVSDELNLYQRALQYDSFAYWFNYPSGYYWIMGLMLVPHMMGPVFIKAVLQGLIAGYVVARQTRLSGRIGWLLYALFCLPFVLEQGISAHRLPTYGLLYLLLMAKLCYDRAERKQLSWPTLVGMSLLIGLLAIWRSEGIYLVPMGAILLCVAYRVKCSRAVLKKLVAYVLAIVLVALPQLKGYFGDSDVSVDLRTKPLCGYALSIMFYNGLTEQMIAEEKADIEGYLKLETIYAYNEAHGDGVYADASVMYAVEDADYATQDRFVEAVKRVILKHPLIYLRAQWNAWLYTSDQYVVDFSGGLQGIVRGLVALSYQPWIPMLLVALFCVLALLRRKWLIFWLTGCGIANWVIVTLLKPATYVKYYYVDYLMGYFLLLAGICWMVKYWRDRHGHTVS